MGGKKRAASTSGNPVAPKQKAKPTKPINKDSNPFTQPPPKGQMKLTPVVKVSAPQPPPGPGPVNPSASTEGVGAAVGDQEMMDTPSIPEPKLHVTSPPESLSVPSQTVS